jgi:hypothetical protein
MNKHMRSIIESALQKAYSDLILCLRQPGGLKISRHACAMRHLLAKRIKNSKPDDEFTMSVKAGLEICRSCPYGRLFAKLFDFSD